MRWRRCKKINWALWVTLPLLGACALAELEQGATLRESDSPLYMEISPSTVIAGECVHIRIFKKQEAFSSVNFNHGYFNISFPSSDKMAAAFANDDCSSAEASKMSTDINTDFVGEFYFRAYKSGISEILISRFEESLEQDWGVLFEVDVQHTTPHHISKVSAPMIGYVGETLDPVIVKVRDIYQNPIPNFPINAEITFGTAAVDSPTLYSDEDGHVEAVVTLGGNPGLDVSRLRLQSLDLSGEPKSLNF